MFLGGDSNKFVVKHKYQAAQPDELTLKPGDVVVHVAAVEEGWAQGIVSFHSVNQSICGFDLLCF